MIVVEINGFHQKVKGSDSLLDWMEFRKWRLFALHLIRIMWRRSFVKIWEVILFDGWFWVDFIVVTGVIWIFWQVTVVLSEFARLWELTVELRELKRMALALLRLFRLRKGRSLYFRQAIGNVRNCGYFPLILSLAHIFELFAMAHLNVCDYSFTFLALSVLVTYVVFVKILQLFWVRYDFPLRILILLACPYPSDWGFSLFTKADHQVKQFIDLEMFNSLLMFGVSFLWELLEFELVSRDEFKTGDPLVLFWDGTLVDLSVNVDRQVTLHHLLHIHITSVNLCILDPWVIVHSQFAFRERLICYLFA